MDDILKEIEKSADDIQIPTSLDQNNVKKKLKERKLSEESNYMNYMKSEYKKVDEEKHKNKKIQCKKNCGIRCGNCFGYRNRQYWNL